MMRARLRAAGFNAHHIVAVNHPRAGFSRMVGLARHQPEQPDQWGVAAPDGSTPPLTAQLSIGGACATINTSVAGNVAADTRTKERSTQRRTLPAVARAAQQLEILE
jgi:hypothetical protein